MKTNGKYRIEERFGSVLEVGEMKAMWKTVRIRNLLQKLLLVVSSTLLILLVLEVVVRVGFSAPKVFPHLMRQFFEHDPLLGWRHKPNYTGLFSQIEHESTLSYNSQGIRGPEYSLAKPENEFRIAILGDSFADGYTVEFENLFSEVLEQRLIERTGQNVEVINFGVAGYSTDQELLLYQKKVKLYQPDLTILMFHDNDVWFNTMAYLPAWGSGYKPLFRIDNGTLKLTNVPVPPHVPHRSKGVGKIKDALHHNSSLYRLVVQRIKDIPKLYSLAVAMKLTDPPYDHEDNLIPKSYGIFRKTYSHEISAAWEITEVLLTEIKKETDTIGSGMLVFYVPQKAVVYTEQWEKLKQYYDLEDDEWNVEQVAQELDNILKRLEIEFINPLEDMRQHNKNPARGADHLYYLIDGHWNNEGNRLVGEIIADYVMEHYGLINEDTQ
ncbi:MAG: hypothetical protein GY774_32775 [Planctomycetes bacterium]|nr:hypothetical protein [Planctomycetota bacterium]